MKKLVIIIAATLATACVIAQEKPRRGRAGQPRGERPPAGERSMAGERPMPMRMTPGVGMWVPRMLSSPASLDKIGVTDESVRAKIVEKIKPLKEEGDQLEQKIREISRDQAQRMRELFDGKETDPKPVLDMIDTVAKLRAKQGRLSVKAILALREELTPEQLEKARGLILERGRERGRMRRGGMGPGGERRGPPPAGGPARDDKPGATDKE